MQGSCLLLSYLGRCSVHLIRSVPSVALDAMELTIVGCSGSFPGPASPASCYLVDRGRIPAADRPRQRRARRVAAVRVARRDRRGADQPPARRSLPRHVLVSGVPDLPSGRPRCLPFPVYAPAGAADRLDRAAGGDSGHPISDAFDFVTLRPGTIEIGPFAVTADHMNHPVETFGFRLEHDGRAIAYSADTGATDRLVGLAHGRGRAALRGVLHRRPRAAARPAPHRPRGRRARDPGRRGRAGAHSPGALERQGGDPGRGVGQLHRALSH